MHGKSIAHKTSSDNIILVNPFLGVCTQTKNDYVSPDLEKRPDLVTVHNGTNDFKSVSWPEEIPNEIISLVLSVKEKRYQIAVSGIVSQGYRFYKEAEDVHDYLKVQCKDHNTTPLARKI